MLAYVFGTIFFLSALFGYADQDFLKSQDDGEKAAAGWMIGYHNGMIQSCTSVIDCSTATGIAKLLPHDTTYQAAYLLKQDGNDKLWLGVQTVSYNSLLFSFYEKTNENGLASRGRNLSLPKIAARLYEASADFQDGTDLWTGIYSASASAVVLSNGFTVQSVSGTVDDEHSQSAGIGPLAGISATQPFLIPVVFGTAGIPIADGAPVIVSRVPCIGGKGQCIGPVEDRSGDPSAKPTPQITSSKKTPLTTPGGTEPGEPPSPIGVWDPGKGGIGTAQPAPPSSPVIVTAPVPPSTALGDCST